MMDTLFWIAVGWHEADGHIERRRARRIDGSRAAALAPLGGTSRQLTGVF